MPKKKDVRKNIERLDTGGWIVEVPVEYGRRPRIAILDRKDWRELRGAGMYPTFEHQDGWVVVWSPVKRRYVRVARLIANANSEQEVYTIDGNELNLRRSNLYIQNPPPPRPIEYDRQRYLSDEHVGVYDSLYETETRFDVAPPFKQDPLAVAYLNNKDIVKSWTNPQNT